MQTTRYQLHEQLGKGGSGVVYRAFDQLTGHEVAMKQLEVNPLEAEFNTSPASLNSQHTMLAHEFRLLASLRHPNIITVLDYGFTPTGKPFFVMELLKNPQNIFDAAQNRDSQGKLDLLIQVLQALACLHRHGIVHRDVKPRNIMVMPDNQVKVLDFGIAIHATDTSQTLVGTAYYMSPEIMNGGKARQASDLWSLGVVAYQMWTGILPFQGKNFVEVAENIIFSDYDTKPLYQTDDLILTQIAPVIERLLMKEPAARYPDAISVIRALCEATGDPLPPEEGEIRESFIQAAPFVGRESEMRQLKTALEEAQQGRGSTWLIGGESGIGKSRLLDELRIHALVNKAVVVRGQLVEGEPFSRRIWRNILRPLLLTTPITDEEAQILKPVIPEIEMLIKRYVADVEMSSPEAFAQVTAQVISRTQDFMLIILEDLHWAGANLEPLHLLLPQVKNLPVLIVGSYRAEEASYLVNHLPEVQYIRLGRLSDHDMAELSRAMLGEAGKTPQVLDLLRRETEGNAFFMVEVVRALAEEAGRLSEVENITLPASIVTGGIHQVMKRRLRHVPQWAFLGLQFAAVMGREIHMEELNKLLAPVLGLITAKNVNISVTVSTIWREERGLSVNDWLLVCADTGIIEVQDGKWRFAHDKLREYVLSSLSEDQIKLLTKQIGKTTST